MAWRLSRKQRRWALLNITMITRYTGGRDRLYNHIAKEKVGITRNMVRDYILNSEAHQLTRPKPAMVRQRAIIVRRPGAQAQVDLVEMQHDAKLNNDFVYILTYIDLFSKWAAARPLKSKEGPEVIEAVDSILGEMKAEHRPRILQSGNGSEFGKAFEAHMKQKWGTKVIHSSGYKPSTQGAVERFNGSLKSLLGRYDSKRWVDIVQACD